MSCRIHLPILALSLFFLFFHPVQAALYPTKPISSTVYTAGAPAQVTWIEDGKRPLLNATYGVRIDLYAGNNTYIATLARDLSALALNTTVFISSNIPKNYNSYTLRFITSEPALTIYTSDFTINPSPFSAPPSPSTATAHTSSLSGLSSLISTATVTSTVISRVLPSTTVKASGAGSKFRGLVGRWVGGGGAEGKINNKGEGGERQASGFGEDAFRLVFIVWPALVGLSMAF